MAPEKKKKKKVKSIELYILYLRVIDLDISSACFRSGLWKRHVKKTFN